MDILGIGIVEMMVIVFLILIVAGPERSLAWSRQAGQYMRQIRSYWQQMMDEFRREVPESEEIIKTAEEVRRNFNEVRQIPRNTIGQAMRSMDSDLKAQNWLPSQQKPKIKQPKPNTTNQTSESTPNNMSNLSDSINPFAAWTPDGQKTQSTDSSSEDPYQAWKLPDAKIENSSEDN